MKIFKQLEELTMASTHLLVLSNNMALKVYELDLTKPRALRSQKSFAYRVANS